MVNSLLSFYLPYLQPSIQSALSSSLTHFSPWFGTLRFPDFHQSSLAAPSLSPLLVLFPWPPDAEVPQGPVLEPGLFPTHSLSISFSPMAQNTIYKAPKFIYFPPRPLPSNPKIYFQLSTPAPFRHPEIISRFQPQTFSHSPPPLMNT